MYRLKIAQDPIKLHAQLRGYFSGQWRLIQSLVLAATSILLVFSFFITAWPFHKIVPFLVFSPLMLTAALTRFFDLWKSKSFKIAAVIIFTSALVVIAGFLDPTVKSPDFKIPDWAYYLCLLIPVSTWLFIARVAQSAPGLARQYSLRIPDFLLDILIGILSGLAIAFQQYLVIAFIPGLEFPVLIFSTQAVLWAGSVVLGILVPAEEILFRGAAFSFLHDHLKHRFEDASARIVIMNLLVYIVVLLHNTESVEYGLISLFFRILVIVFSLFIVRQRRTLLPGIVANFLYSLITGQLFYL